MRNAGNHNDLRGYRSAAPCSGLPYIVIGTSFPEVPSYRGIVEPPINTKRERPHNGGYNMSVEWMGPINSSSSGEEHTWYRNHELMENSGSNGKGDIAKVDHSIENKVKVVDRATQTVYCQVSQASQIVVPHITQSAQTISFSSNSTQTDEYAVVEVRISPEPKRLAGSRRENDFDVPDFESPGSDNSSVEGHGDM